MKFYVLVWNCEEYVEMSMEEIQEKYGDAISGGGYGCEVLVVTAMENDAIYLQYTEFEC